MSLWSKQHLSNTWVSIHWKVKQQWGWAEKNVAYIKRRVFKHGDCSVTM